MLSPYLALMKLRVVELLLVTTLPALFLAVDGIPPLRESLVTLICGTLAAGAANAFNMVIESDIDKVMTRTKDRPIVNEEISSTRALSFAFVIAALSLIGFWFFTNPLTTALTASAIVFYVFVYTVGLKRRTPQNIVWGGIAGCMPVLIGWAAVTDTLAWPAIWFFLTIFFWTPPHFWALAIKYKDDYAAAGVPMLPVVAPIGVVARQMWFHTIAMIAVSLVTLYSAGLPIWTYPIAALLGAGFALQLRDPASNANRIFNGSITYLSLYSILLVATVLI